MDSVRSSIGLFISNTDRLFYVRTVHSSKDIARIRTNAKYYNYGTADLAPMLRLCRRPEMSRCRSRSCTSTPSGVCRCSYRAAKQPDNAHPSIHPPRRLSARQAGLCLGRGRAGRDLEEPNFPNRPTYENRHEISWISPTIQSRNSHWGSTLPASATQGRPLDLPSRSEPMRLRSRMREFCKSGSMGGPGG